MCLVQSADHVVQERTGDSEEKAGHLDEKQQSYQIMHIHAGSSHRYNI